MPQMNYDDLARDYAAHRRVQPEVLRRLVDDAGLTGDSAVLDVGCGTGNYTLALESATGCAATGVDPSEQMLAAARAGGGRARFVQGSAERLDFPTASFDLVLSVDVIHHVQDQPAFYREAARILKPGGAICTVTDSEDIIRRRVPLSVYFPETVEVELRRYPRIEDLRDMMVAAGFAHPREALAEFAYELGDDQPYRDKAFSSLHLIPPDALERGLARMRADLRRGPIPCTSRYVMLWGAKPHTDGPAAAIRLTQVHANSPGLAAMLDALTAGVRAALGDNAVGMYLRGSLVLGDFDPTLSDIDTFVVTERPITQDEFGALAAMHARVNALPNPFANRVEAVYLDRDAVRRFRPGERHATLGQTETLAWSTHGPNWILERWAVREHGLTLFGPDPKALIDPVDPADIRAAVRSRLDDWGSWAAAPDNPEWLPPRSHQAYAVETMCRALCTLATGELPSKPRGVAWAIATLPEPWPVLVARAFAGRKDPTPDPDRIADTLSFVQWAAAQAGGDELPWRAR